ncbi:MAG: hypothetical protein JWM72_4728 [Actinomycetia bacterium]|nr:hypothetical protein [Actinomycetes bacterium]
MSDDEKPRASRSLWIAEALVAVLIGLAAITGGHPWLLGLAAALLVICVVAAVRARPRRTTP